MSSNQTDPSYSPQSPDQPPSLLSHPLTTSLGEQQQPRMDTMDEQGTDGMQLSSTALKSWESTTSIGSRTAEEKEEDEIFDKIEDLLGDLMNDPSAQHLPCRLFQWSLPGNPSRVLSAMVAIGQAIQKK